MSVTKKPMTVGSMVFRAMVFTAVAVALLATGAGFAWLGMESRRNLQVQREWKNAHDGGTE